MQSSLLLVAIAFTCATLAVELRAGPLRRFHSNSGRLGSFISDNKDTTTCKLNTTSDDVLFIFIGNINPDTENATDWAFAGVRENDNSFCIDAHVEYKEFIYRFDRSNKQTNGAALDSGGCLFQTYDCMDPVLQQQIVDSGICAWNGATAQQIVDRMMLQLNRVNWLYIATDWIDGLDLYYDDSFCQVEMDNGFYVVAAKVVVT